VAPVTAVQLIVALVEVIKLLVRLDGAAHEIGAVVVVKLNDVQPENREPPHEARTCSQYWEPGSNEVALPMVAVVLVPGVVGVAAL
jgi:hypothetical protein